MDPEENPSLLCYAIFTTEFIGECTLVVISIFVLRSVYRCSVLHANLKVFLICKSTSSIVSAGARLSSLVLYFVQGTPMYTASIHASFLMHVCSSINAYLSIGYATERLLATVMMPRYEKQRPYYGCLFTAILVVVTIYNAGSDHYWRSSTRPTGYSINTIITSYTTSAVGLLCLIVVYFLNRYNRRRYFKDFYDGNFGNLTGRYQNLENVRTTWQLIPVIALHTAAGIDGSIFVTCSILFPYTVEDKFYRIMAINLANCYIYILCQVAMLYFHPALRSDTAVFLRRLQCCVACRWPLKGRVKPLSRTHGIVVVKPPMSPEEEGQVYFQNLVDDWDRHYEATGNWKR